MDFEGCPIHPTRVDSSLVFVIRKTGNRFMNPIPSHLRESFPLLSIRHAGSWFARDLERNGWSGPWGWVENVVDSSQFHRIDRNHTNRLKFVATFLRTRKVHVSLFHGSWLPIGYAGWVEKVVDSSQFDRLDTNRFPCCRFVMPLVDLRDATPCKSSWDVTCKSSRIIKCPRRIDSVWVYWTWMWISVYQWYQTV